MKQSIAKLANFLGSLLVSAFFWLLVFSVGGAALIAVGVGMQFGVGLGCAAGGVLAVLYSAVVLKGMSDG
ncbi:hypothetical protein [Comamonas sp. B21-038]|uniref:hypothetical protein n=1 Tax=Comamonas sp. B21-038 TaxID=2918299 RepID=UPI001EFB2B5D|nr:hypothetical protein [Comamonas sp. B21-038]ULR87185.1 hypothetical protein MJ205_11910 [Comamonas sp. B21-038]